MRHFIGQIILFLCFLTPLYVIYLCGWGTLTPKSFKKNLNYEIGSYGHMFSRIKDISMVSDVDILFLGSSHVYRGIDPRIFEHYGISIFNLGSSAQTPIQTELLLHRYLERLQPKMIVYDIYPESFDSDGIESSLDIIANSKNDFESVKMAFKINHVKTYNTLLYGFYRDIFKLNADFEEHRIKGQDMYISNGFVSKKLRYNPYRHKHDIAWRFKDKQCRSFDAVIDIIKKEKIPYVLIQIPVTSLRYKGYRNKSVFDTFIKSKGNYYNFNDLIQLDDSLHFYDTQHLNRKGVALFDNFLIKQLLKQ